MDRLARAVEKIKTETQERGKCGTLETGDWAAGANVGAVPKHVPAMYKDGNGPSFFEFENGPFSIHDFVENCVSALNFAEPIFEIPFLVDADSIVDRADSFLADTDITQSS